MVCCGECWAAALRLKLSGVHRRGTEWDLIVWPCVSEMATIWVLIPDGNGICMACLLLPAFHASLGKTGWTRLGWAGLSWVLQAWSGPVQYVRVQSGPGRSGLVGLGGVGVGLGGLGSSSVYLVALVCFV